MHFPVLKENNEFGTPNRVLLLFGGIYVFQIFSLQMTHVLILAATLLAKTAERVMLMVFIPATKARYTFEFRNVSWLLLTEDSRCHFL